MSMRHHIVTAARGMRKTPFRHQGRAPGIALDCAGLIITACAQCGIYLDDVSCYSQNPDGKTLVEHLDRVLNPISITEIQAADVVVMWFEQWPTHLAMITDVDETQYTIIHAHRQREEVIEHRLDSRWSGRIVRAYSIPGVDQ